MEKRYRAGGSMFEMFEKIRYSEVDKSCHLTRMALLNYFQDCSVAQSESVGMGVSFLAENHIAWLLTAWQIIIEEMPELGDEVIVQTWPYDFKGLYGYRNFMMKNADGTKIYAYANSIWALVDTESGRPRKVEADFAQRYGLEPGLEMATQRKIRVPENFTQMDAVKVPRYYIDTNGHMNNEKYVMVAEEFLPENFSVGEIQAVYKRSAMYDDVICPRVTREENSMIVNLADETGKPYAIVRFIERGME